MRTWDKVPHTRLLQKLDHWNKRHIWIKDFLPSHTQQVVLKGSFSATSPVTSGVPQCSVLGPLLFIAYINDLPFKVQSTTRLFADDCLLYRTIRSPDDSRQLQHDLDSLQSWENDWQMAFNWYMWSHPHRHKTETDLNHLYPSNTPHLAGHPHSACLINQLEIVQRRATISVKHDSARTSSVTNMVTDLKWVTFHIHIWLMF